MELEGLLSTLSSLFFVPSLSHFKCRERDNDVVLGKHKAQPSNVTYDQVRNDYLKKNFESLDLDTAIQLCCIEIRRFFKDMPQIALDKKSNFEYLEKEVGPSFVSCFYDQSHY